MFHSLYILLCWFALVTSGSPSPTARLVAKGHLPVITTDEQGSIHLVYGQDSTIYYALLDSQSKPVIQTVAVLPGLVAAAKRGPQLALTDNAIIVTAVNRAGNVFAYSQARKTGKWSAATRVNDVPEVAKEGFQALAGTASGIVYATWLDLRKDQQNKIVMAKSIDGGRSWLANQTVYRSPSGTVCECCRVSMAANRNDVYIQFRNWLADSRDLYLVHSADGGKTFAPAQKLGQGTWKINACPMDGGTVVLMPQGQPLTVWRRENTLFSCRPNQAEQAVATGKNVTAAIGLSGTALAWDQDGAIWLKLNNSAPISLGTGQIPSVAVSGKSAVCAWEDDGQVMTATVAF